MTSGRLSETKGGANAKLQAEYPAETWLTDPVRTITMRLGYLLLAPHLSTLLGRDVFSPEEIALRSHQNVRMHELVRKGLKTET